MICVGSCGFSLRATAVRGGALTGRQTFSARPKSAPRDAEWEVVCMNKGPSRRCAFAPGNLVADARSESCRAGRAGEELGSEVCSTAEYTREFPGPTVRDHIDTRESWAQRTLHCLPTDCHLADLYDLLGSRYDGCVVGPGRRVAVHCNHFEPVVAWGGGAKPADRGQAMIDLEVSLYREQAGFVFMRRTPQRASGFSCRCHPRIRASPARPAIRKAL
jgi:hypothetical protein